MRLELTPKDQLLASVPVDHDTRLAAVAQLERAELAWWDWELEQGHE
jgi:hypothetical protein